MLRQENNFGEVYIKKHPAFESVMNQGLLQANDDWHRLPISGPDLRNFNISGGLNSQYWQYHFGTVTGTNQCGECARE